MKFAYSWLLEYLDTKCDPSHVVNELSFKGIEAQLLPGISSQQGLSSFVVARVEEVSVHPSADRLSVCKVFDGSDVLQIVCGASNVYAGMITVLAREGSVVPKSGLLITRTVIRGVESFGMLCSLAELGVSDIETSGIADLSGYEVGEKFFPSGEIVEVTVTPNRGDCLGVYGIARELAAAGVGTLKPLPAVVLDGTSLLATPIDVEMSYEGIFRGRSLKSIKNKNDTPRWIRDRLISSGVKVRSCVVDILNYVMLLLNMPMHVYDMAVLGGRRLIVERAGSSKSFVALNDKCYELYSEDVVVRDGSETVHCLAGVIGSKASGCTCGTEDVFLEAAWFDPVDIAMTSRQHKITTEASYRFTRATDFRLLEYGLDYATDLVLKYCGGIVCEVVHLSNRSFDDLVVDFRWERVAEIGNIDIKSDRVSEILLSLGFTVDSNDEKVWKIGVPSWRRSDIKIEVDLVEEVMRVHGYNNVKEEQLGVPQSSTKGEFSSDLFANKVRLTMLSLGLAEVITWSFLSKEVMLKFGFSSDDLKIENPISSQFDMMRPTILSNLLQVAANNQACGLESVGIFEIGDIYLALDKSEQVICGLRSGSDLPRNLYTKCRGFDFFDVKSDIEHLVLQAGISKGNLELKPSERMYLHPARAADIYLCGVSCGYVGEVHPELVEFFRLKSRAVCFEVSMSSLQRYCKSDNKKEEFSIIKYQPVKRDFAFVVDKDMQAGTLVDSIRTVKQVEEVEVFDMYKGAGIPDDKVSIAVAVIIRSKKGTMTDLEIKEISDSIIGAVEVNTGGKLRLDWDT